MADPGAKAIMIGGVEHRDFGAHLVNTVDKFSAWSGVNVLAGKGREQPGCAFKKIGVGKLHPGAFFARHGMTGEESLRPVSSERFRGPLDNFRLGAANIGDQSRWG